MAFRGKLDLFTKDFSIVWVLEDLLSIYQGIPEKKAQVVPSKTQTDQGVWYQSKQFTKEKFKEKTQSCMRVCYTTKKNGPVMHAAARNHACA